MIETVKTRNWAVKTLGAALFWIGLALGFALAAGAAWADVEAKFYGFQQYTNEPLKSLRCPALMTRSDTAAMSASFSNPLDRPIVLTVQSEISTPGLPITERVVLSMAPGETRRYQWTLTPQDIDLGGFVFAHVVQFPTYGQPLREATCGVAVVPIAGLSGSQVFSLALLGCLLGVTIGLGLWQRAHHPLMGRPRNTLFAMTFLAALVLAALLASLLGWWVIAGALLIIAALMIASLAYFAVAG